MTLIKTGLNASMDKKTFLHYAQNSIIPPLYAEIPYHPPSSIYQRFSGPYSILFESAGLSQKIARYSFIGFDPYIIFSAKDRITEVIASHKRTISNKHPLKKLRELTSAYKQIPSENLPPFQGGAMGLLCYDFVRYIEKIPCKNPDTLALPDAHFLFIDKLIAFDHLLKKAWAIVCPGVRDTQLGYKDLSEINWAEKYEEALIELNNICLRHAPLSSSKTNKNTEKTSKIEIVSETPKAQYMDMVRRAKDYIAAGDIFQANLSLRVSANFGKRNPWSLYKTLCAVNPSPFACFMDFGSYQIVSSSPERLLMVRNRTIETRPIAGTRPRGKDTAEDAIMRAELLLSEKERAEHIMLIDLERNDAGKVSDYGTVEVDELMTTEDYSHVIHIVSNIKGRLASGKDSFDAIRAFFPGGTITGVPKVRCMEIIDELEPVRRGPYTGSAGYIGFSGDADFNIIIRTFLIKDGIAYAQAGAGIVADSEPEKEYYECLKKAEALIKSLNLIDKSCYNIS